MKENTCCFTGHRKIAAAVYPLIEKQLQTRIEQLILQGVMYFRTGGALGFDTLAALTVLQLKKKYPDIALILVLPCRDQAKNWDTAQVQLYENIKNRADQVIYVEEQYVVGCMQKRNRHLVDNSSYCIAYLCNKKGGTAYTVYYAQKNGLKVINLAEKEPDTDDKNIGLF